MRGIVKPNPPYKIHIHAGIRILEAGREFIVDEKAQADVDKDSAPLVLTAKTYEAMRAKFGSVLVCEPVGAATGEAAAKRISELEAKVAELEAQLAAKQGKK